MRFQAGSSRNITITIGWLNATPGGKNLTIAPRASGVAYPICDGYNVTFSTPDANGLVPVTIPKESFISTPFYLMNVTLLGSPFSFYTWGQLELVDDGDGTLAIEDDVLDVDMTVTVTGYGNGTYAHGVRTVGDGTPDPAGSMMIDMPLNLTIWVGTSPTDPTWQADLVEIEFPMWLTTGKTNVTIIDPAPFPTGTDSLHGYTTSAQGVPGDPYNGSTTLVATGGGLDLYFDLLGAPLYNDFMFKEVEVISLQQITSATVSPNEVYQGQPVNISVAGVNQLYYPTNYTVTVKAYGPQEITINVTTFNNVDPGETITLSVPWDTADVFGIYTVRVEARGSIKIDGTIVNCTDIWVAGTVKVNILGDLDGDGDVDPDDRYIFAKNFGKHI